MEIDDSILPNQGLKNVRYEIRGPLNRRADELIRSGEKIIKLNIGNPGAFGFRTPPHLAEAIVKHMPDAEGYVHQKGVPSQREAIARSFVQKGIPDADPERIFVGNGCSDLIMMAMRALLNPGDEVLVPSPDYPLWTASVVIHDGKPIHYPCRVENGFVPVAAELETLVTPKTRALVLINPNNPTGVVYPEQILKDLAALAEKHKLIVFADEIYDNMLYDGAQHFPMAKYVKSTLCGSFGGLSKVYLACGYRVGWLAFTGNTKMATDYLMSMDLLSGLRLCSNAPGQFAIEAALFGPRSIDEYVKPGGRLYETRKIILAGIQASKYLFVAQVPYGAMYVFVGVKTDLLPEFNDHRFAMDLLEKKKVLVVPGSSFNVKYHNHFRLTLLPTDEQCKQVFIRMEELLDSYKAESAVKA
eukprot:CAMPEP_0196656008 /NCGR_PEP_ID=MMETSP1086-20130531/11841_1 /TAXON_ID=77921 /ORGANISM="Cyanoptyche  gloeocystis , Strain SAG4.97" /LENGTH=414 /DNA_ID=CAMNT_0041988579 /DNA_START=349 /DNA_END=1593 /DNA_ORIENTATION=-